ncbi:hypothetical protein [Paenibacillus rhizophilus]|uniref:Uncharacterized protein n=1 Tax=Paenibacillus rhizophilus TaxID=1850366 RepID=A0A3N9P2N0_9BACL|nr:hypothetical protein [Paenibacillus rhizophilus]RQW10045.1 hypothetical protein EH198_16555 [Paenibacillus rhizophilus]
MQPWASNPDKAKPVIVTLADGINQSQESIEIADGQCTAAVNMDSLLYPTLQTVSGYSLHSVPGGYVNRLFKFLGVWYCGNGNGLYKFTGSSWTAVYDHGNTNNERLWDAAMFFDGSKMYFIDGNLQLQQWDGTTLTALGSAPAGSDFLTTHANRFYLSNRSDNLLSYSGLRDAADWTSTDKYTGTGKITVETPDGEKPTGLVAYSNHVILFKKYTMHELYGEDSTNFQMQQPYGVGCVSDRSIVPTNSALYWLAADGVYAYGGGAVPTKISEPVKKYIESINQAYAHHCTAGTDARFLYLSLVTGSAQTPNVTLKYDLQGGRWWPCSLVATAYYLDGQTLYMALSDGRIVQAGGDTEAGNAISWSIETKPFSEGDETVRKSINRVWVIADIEVGSTLNIAYAAGTEGSDWNVVSTIANGTGQIRSTRIPVIVRTPETWYRLKLYGTGKVKIHRIVREVSRRNA